MKKYIIANTFEDVLRYVNENDITDYVHVNRREKLPGFNIKAEQVVLLPNWDYNYVNQMIFDELKYRVRRAGGGLINAGNS
jgi:hypothetical protein